MHSQWTWHVQRLCQGNLEEPRVFGGSGGELLSRDKQSPSLFRSRFYWFNMHPRELVTGKPYTHVNTVLLSWTICVQVREQRL